jgi:transposase-like protein
MIQHKNQISTTSNNEGMVSGVDSFSSMDELPETNKNKNNNTKSRKHYTNEFKHKVVQQVASGKNIYDVANENGVDRRRIGEWSKAKDKLEKQSHKRSTYKIETEKDLALFPVMEAELYKWIMEKRAINSVISGTLIKLEAAEFKASGGWLKNFLRRKNLVLRRITTTGRDLPVNTISIVKEFIDKFHQIETKDPNSFFINGDETAIYLDAPGQYTYSPKGNNKIKILNIVIKIIIIIYIKVLEE